MPDNRNFPFDVRVRLAVYAYMIEHARGPSAANIAAEIDEDAEEVQAAFNRLYDGHQLVLHDNGDIWMAMPISAVETDFIVESGGKRWWGN